MTSRVPVAALAWFRSRWRIRGMSIDDMGRQELSLVSLVKGVQ